VYGDFDHNDSDSFRIPGRALALFDASPQARLVMGSVYLDWETVSLLPAAGVVYTPDSDTRFELVFPRPKIGRRLHRSGELESWIYFRGEYGGGSWAIERVNGADDVMTYRDLRLIVGVESKDDSGIGGYWELGYVFDRDLDYERGPGDYSPDETLMLRVGSTY
jgi:hypothetical protein